MDPVMGGRASERFDRVESLDWRRGWRRLSFVATALVFVAVGKSHAQTAKVRDLTIREGEVPVRLVGYGLVVGLEGTGDRTLGGMWGGMTVRSVANLLRNLGVEVPDQVIRTRNAAAVLVTAEASPYTRRGGRFDVTVASLGDATSLRGGQLWQTPLLASVGGPPVALAQGALQVPAGGRGRGGTGVGTSATLVGAATALVDLGGGGAAPPSRLLLRNPDLATARRIADAVNLEIGQGIATVIDAGAIALDLPPDDPIAALVALEEIDVPVNSAARVVIDARSGAVAAGGDLVVGPAVVSSEWLTLAVGPGAPDGQAASAEPSPGVVRAEAGVRVQDLVEALHSIGATSEMIGSVFRALEGVGALRAEVLVR
jgi:flagellar P-ring protein precursor FlgI